MPFEKGHKLSTGRPVGSQNKLTKASKDFLRELLFDKEQMLEDWLKLDVNGRIELRTRLAPYLLTKAKEEEFKPHPSRGIDFKKLVNAIAFKNTPEDDTTKLPS
tara:strand:- start:524 stop:835 length:312 start_codon:yes stop_codon:yes gene_type:complete